jgi:hypothetical protein
MTLPGSWKHFIRSFSRSLAPPSLRLSPNTSCVHPPPCWMVSPASPPPCRIHTRPPSPVRPTSPTPPGPPSPPSVRIWCCFPGSSVTVRRARVSAVSHGRRVEAESRNRRDEQRGWRWRR